MTERTHIPRRPCFHSTQCYCVITGHYFPFYIQGVETVTFKQPESRDTKHVYTIYVEWTAPVGNEEVTFPDTNAWVSLTDGIITEEIHMEAKVSEHYPS